MKITKRGFICLAVCMLAASLFARPHHHKPLPQHAHWCVKCDGDGYYWTWYGWRRTCNVCGGRGYIVTPPPPPPPKPAPGMHHGGGHHGGPVVAPKPGPKPVVKPGPAPKPAPQPPRGAPRR